MKTLAIRGKVKAFDVDYKVLFSDFKKDFAKLPVDTQIRCIQELIVEMASMNTLSHLQKSFAVESLNCLIRNLQE